MSHNATPPPRPVGYTAVPADVANGIKRFIAQHGERAAVVHFGLSRTSLARVAAGLTVQGGTLFVARDGLARAAALESSGAQ